MSDSMFKKMPLHLDMAYAEVAEMQAATAESEKRVADAQTLGALADALKKHGTKKQYAASQAALVAFFDKVVDDLGLELEGLHDAK